MILKNRNPKQRVPLQKIRSLLSNILRELGIPKADLDVSFVDDRAIRLLNRKFRGIDRATDVLSFPLWEKKEAFRDGQFLGDVVLSIPTVKRQARALGKPVLEEMAFLLIHGTLHLLGYDHEGSQKEARRMQRMERKLMKRMKYI
jgi:probable rRNA maturation factor